MGIESMQCNRKLEQSLWPKSNANWVESRSAPPLSCFRKFSQNNFFFDSGFLMNSLTIEEIIQCHRRLVCCANNPESSELRITDREWADTMRRELEAAFTNFFVSPHGAGNRIYQIVVDVNYALAEVKVDAFYQKKKRLT